MLDSHTQTECGIYRATIKTQAKHYSVQLSHIYPRQTPKVHQKLGSGAGLKRFAYLIANVAYDLAHRFLRQRADRSPALPPHHLNLPTAIVTTLTLSSGHSPGLTPFMDYRLDLFF